MNARPILTIALIGLLSGCGSGGIRDVAEDYPDRTPRQRGQVDGYKPIGSWQTYHVDGTLKSEGVFVDGRQDGKWTYGHPGGIPAGIGHWKNGVQHGWWSRRNTDGIIVSAGLMLEGRRHGPWLLASGMNNYASSSTVTEKHIKWFDDSATVTWTHEQGKLVVQSTWPAANGAWNQSFDDPATTKHFTAFTSPSPEQPVAEKQTLPAAITPAQNDVELTPVPPLIEFGGMIKTFAASIEQNFMGETKEALKEIERNKKRSQPRSDNDILRKLPNNNNPRTQLITGMKLPQQRFVSGSGDIIDLSTPKKPTLLVIMRGFSGSVCLYCASQTAALSNKIADLNQSGLEVIILYPGPASTVPAFIDAVQQLNDDPPPMPVALDVNQLLVSGLGIEGELSKPTSLLIGTDGKIKWAYIGNTMQDRPKISDYITASQLIK